MSPWALPVYLLLALRRANMSYFLIFGLCNPGQWINPPTLRSRVTACGIIPSLLSSLFLAFLSLSLSFSLSLSLSSLSLSFPAANMPR